MNLHLHQSKIDHFQHELTITGSKSESNRLLLLRALYPKITIENLSNSDDSLVMQMALASTNHIIDVHHAGTAMRFLTAFFAIQDGREVTLTGSFRMKERPMKVLVDALNSLGAEITYLEKEGFPPLKIKGKALSKNKVELQANVSSQYISALLLIAPKLKNGLEIVLLGEITSAPYIKMTLQLLNEIGIETSFRDNRIIVDPMDQNEFETSLPKHLVVESDWSSASYFYSIVALSPVGTKIKLGAYKKDSLQGDSVLVDIYKQLGVGTTFLNSEIIISKELEPVSNPINFNLNNSPDIAQTIAVTCFGLGLECHLTGLHTLKIKETDRLEALKTELQKLSANVEITADSLTLLASKKITRSVSIATYNDHRMAMAFAPLALKTDLQIEDAMVVSKSYPTFWEDLKKVGIKITQE